LKKIQKGGGVILGSYLSEITIENNREQKDWLDDKDGKVVINNFYYLGSLLLYFDWT